MAIKSGRQLIDEAKARCKEVTAREVQQRVAAGEKMVLLDIREPDEWNLGHIPDADYMARGVLETTIEGRIPRESTLILYCASGNRSALAAVTLQEMGYNDVASMAGGFKDWVATGGDIED